MTIGIIPNITKENIVQVVKTVLKKLRANDFNFILCDSLKKIEKEFKDELKNIELLNSNEISKKSDFIMSIGGDGTMLTTAYEVRKSGTPMFGVNIGKLGFLAEFDLNTIDVLFSDIKKGNYFIEERMSFDAICTAVPNVNLYAVNDIVINRGKWPKMIELTIMVDDSYVSTFSADGIIIATPTGTTGYSLSTGGPIVSPRTNAITLSPISPHTLTIRPLVLSSGQKISVSVKSPHASVQINCDGQRVNYFEPPVTIEVHNGKYPVKLLHSHSFNYFEVLRNKLYWGLDIRNNLKFKKDEK
jgi:NAD+ kinase